MTSQWLCWSLRSVTYCYSSPALSTQSGVLAVTTGLPASLAFSMAVSCPDVEGLHIDGVPVKVTVRLADRYNNPAPDGTTVAFTASGGHVGGNCTTPSSAAASGDGTCSVDWTSANPRPTPSSTPPAKRTGRVAVLGTAIGEESFNDVNANGFFDPGEAFSDLAEPYRDDNESAAYESGEYFLDFNHDGIRTPASGSFWELPRRRQLQLVYSGDRRIRADHHVRRFANQCCAGQRYFTGCHNSRSYPVIFFPVPG